MNNHRIFKMNEKLAAEIFCMILSDEKTTKEQKERLVEWWNDDHERRKK